MNTIKRIQRALFKTKTDMGEAWDEEMFNWKMKLVCLMVLGYMLGRFC
jgi:hypothetical protein